MSETGERLDERRRARFQSDDAMRRVAVEGAKKWWNLAQEAKPVAVTSDLMGTITTRAEELTPDQVRTEAHARVDLALSELMMQAPLYPAEVSVLREDFYTFLRESDYSRE